MYYSESQHMEISREDAQKRPTLTKWWMTQDAMEDREIWSMSWNTEHARPDDDDDDEEKSYTRNDGVILSAVCVGCRLCVLGWNCTSQVAECNLKLKDVKCTLHVARCMLQVACYRLQAAGTGYWLQLQVVGCLPPVTFCKVTNWQKLYSGMSKSNIFQFKIT